MPCRRKGAIHERHVHGTAHSGPFPIHLGLLRELATSRRSRDRSLRKSVPGDGRHRPTMMACVSARGTPHSQMCIPILLSCDSIPALSGYLDSSSSYSGPLRTPMGENPMAIRATWV